MTLLSPVVPCPATASPPGWRRLAVLLVAIGIFLVSAPAASAAPDIQLTKDAPPTVLYGDDSRVTLTVANPAGQPYGYNLSIRDVLPAGVSYVPGSAPVEPRILPNAPNTGQTTLIFDNVSDLSPGSSYALSYEVRHDTTEFGIGEQYTNQAGAYINEDPRFVPDFNAQGLPVGDFTGSATDSATTQINAIEIEKSEPSPEGELLRGAHDHQTVYTLTVRNNGIEPTTGLVVEDWLPAGLEYLGCGTADNTTDAPTNPAVSAEEYAGSGPLNPGNAPSAPECQAPNLVETVVTDPDGAGPLPTGVYTHVVWNGLGVVPAGGQLEIQYVAAVPLRENTMTWTSPLVPTPASLAQGSNLDNNSGAETQDEQALTNYARVAGNYDGTLPVSDDHSITRTAEDLRVLKSVDPETINQGQLSTWSLRIDTSEYRYVDNVRVTDTLPDGLCPLGTANLEGGGNQQAECNPVAGQLPNAPYTTVTESADGSWTLNWNQTTVPALQRMQPSSTFTIEFPTRTRAFYQEDFEDDQPVRTHDTWENTVDIAGADFRICTPASPEDCTAGGTKIAGDEPDGQDDFDVSAASQAAGGVELDKTVREAGPAPVDCATGNYIDGPPPNYGPGDRVCWQLRIDFAALLDTGDPLLTDFMPPGVEYVPGSAAPTPNNAVPSTFSDADAANGVLTWDLGTDVAEGGLVFEWRFATTVQQGVGDAAGDVLGNLMKLSYENTEGESFPLRDQVDFERSEAQLDLVKGVRDVNGTPAAGNPANTDGATVVAGDVVTFRVDVTNGGDLDAEDAVIWDELQDGITCPDVIPASISHGGTCSGTRITWTGVDVAAAGSQTLTYDVTMPAGVAPGQRFDNNAGVVSYTSDTNTGGSFTYVPQNNIDPGAPAPNAPAADDPSHVQTPALTFNKTRTTAVTEAGNTGPDQATIGERIDYTMTLVIPAGTTVYGGRFHDVLGPRHGLSSSSATLNGGPLPGGFLSAEDPFAGFYEVTFTGAYTNPAGSGADTFVFRMSAPVADVAGNSRTSPNQILGNTANFDWQATPSSPRQTATSSVNTTIVEPNVQVTKDENDADDVVSPGQTIDYTVTARNVAGTRVSMAHDLQLVDHVPAGLTPVTPIANGGVWDPGARTITWTITSLAPGAQQVRNYSATVDNPATAGSIFDNEVDLTATSMAGAVPDERGPLSPITAGYVDDATDSVRLADATLTKDVSPGSATVGDEVTYTINVTFPGSITYYDATVIDTLPDGMDFDSTVSVTCGGGACTPAVTPLTPEPQPDGSTRLGWFLDDLPNQPAARNYTITYTAHVDDTYVPEGTAVSNGQTLTNVAGAFYNGQDLIAGIPPSIPPNNSFEDGSGPDNAQVNVVEPVVAIDKNVSDDPDGDDARPTQPGDSYTYSLVVRNTGTSPAYDVEVTDTPDETKLDNIQVVPNPAANVTDGDGSDGSLGWTIPGPIAPNGSVTLTYTADLVPSAELSDGDTVVNTADVPLYWGVPLAERLANPLRDYRQYTNVPDDTVTLTVHLPQLAVSKTTGGPGFPESAVAQVGEPFPWRVVVSNTATQAVANSVDIEDVLPPGWTYVAGSASRAPGGPMEPTVVSDPNGDTLTWGDVANLAPGGQVVLTFQARPTVAAIAAGTGAGSPHVNDASAEAVDESGAPGSADGPYSAGPDPAQAILELPDLGVNKTPDGDPVDAGEDATYSVVVSNTGPVPARDVVVRDVLGAGQTYTPGTATALPAAGFSEFDVTPGPGGATTIEWRIAQIPAGGSVTITVPVATDSSLPAGTSLVNTASVTSREITSPDTDPGSYQTTVDSDVGIVKTAQAADVNAGEEMDFTMRVTNHGPSDATGVTVEDALPPNLEFVSATSPPCTENTGTVTCALGDLAAGDFVDLTLRVRVDPNETSGVSNTATVESITPDSNPNNNESTANKPVGVAANVRVQKTAPTAPVLQGTSFDYVIRVENAGVSAATNVTLTDVLPGEVQYESVTPDPGPCSESGGTIDCAFGTLQPGDSVEVRVRVLAVDVGTPLNTAVVSTPSNETTTTDNESTAPVEIVPTADLGVTKTAPATATPGSEIDYELEIVNNGASPATGVSVVDTLPAGVQLVSADPDCGHAGGIVTCAVGDLAVSDSRSYTVTVLIPFALGGQTLTNTAVVAGNEGDLVGDNDSDQATTEVEPAADLAITKTAGGATAGETASWTIVVRNNGPSTADPVTVADTLPAGTTFASATPSQGSCTGGADVTCNLGALASGGSAQISVVASVAAGTAGQTLRNRATVTAPQVDPDPSNNEAESVTEIVAPAPGGPNVTLRKTASTERPELGKPFRYRLLVRNEGDEAAKRVRVIDTLNKSVRFRNVTTTKGRCSEDASTVECSIRTLAAGAEATVTLTVVPTDPGPLRNAASATIGRGRDIRLLDNRDVLGVRVRALAARLGVSKTAARRSVRGGETVRFRIAVRTRKRALADAWVCDRLPAGLVFVRARGATFRKGRACWQVGYMRPGSKRVVRVLTRAERGFTRRSVRNVGVAGAMNARRRADAARVQVEPAFGGVGGGVTG